MSKFINNFFRIHDSGSNIRTELLAGVTTFMTMSYIIFVNPEIIAKSGMPSGAVMVATCLASAIGSLVMGLYANYPIGLAPSMGINAFFTFGLVLGMGLTWQSALTAIFIEGIVFILLTIFSIRSCILKTIPKSLKIGIPVGIGVFLIFIGLQSAGIVVKDTATLITLGSLHDTKVILSMTGFFVTLVLYTKRVKGAILWGICIVTVVAVIVGATPVPNGIVSLPPSISPIFFKMDFSSIVNLDFIVVVLVLLFMDIFNTAGTLIGVANRTGLLDEHGNLVRSNAAFMADAVGTTAGAALGVTTVTVYIESVTGVEEGGRTGLTAVIVAILFFFAMFFSPLISIVPGCATAPALIFVGMLMISIIKELDFDDWTESAPSLISAIMMPFTYNIATGIEFGVVSYVIIKALTGKFKDISIVMLILAILFITKEVFVRF